MVFIYPLARLITPALVPLTALADALEILQPSTVGSSGAGRRSYIILCASATQRHGRSAEDLGKFVTAHTKKNPPIQSTCSECFCTLTCANSSPGASCINNVRTPCICHFPSNKQIFIREEWMGKKCMHLMHSLAHTQTVQFSRVSRVS